MKTKYDWSNVPKEVQWIATDDDGVMNGFDEKPIIGENGLWTTKDYDYERIFELDQAWCSHLRRNWMESLEERPV